MKRIILFLMLFTVLLSACVEQSQGELEQSQQKDAINAITLNQPVPDLGGFSLEREIVIQTYLARNTTISSYTYMITYDGRIIEVCNSIAYPIPYATQLTNPEVLTYNRYPSGAGNMYIEGAIDNAEPNGLYTPDDASATLVQCVNSDGSVSPVYIEENIMSFPYRIEADIVLKRVSDSSFTVDVGR